MGLPSGCFPLWLYPIMASLRRPNSFLGPAAPWMDDEDDTVYMQVLHSTAESLAQRLNQRIEAIRSDSFELNEDAIVLECRRQMAECAVDGQVFAVSDIAELILTLLQAREHRNRL